MGREKFDYEIIKPDQSLIKIKRGYSDEVGFLTWNDRTHKYEFLGTKAINDEEIIEIVGAMKDLNKKSKLPKWLQWGSITR